jgi:putative membrane protein
MDILYKLIVVAHILGLVLGMGSGMALSRMGPFYGQAGEAKGVLFSFGRLLGKNGHIGLGLLWVTGILLIIMKWDITSMSPWFWAKMVFVVILSAGIGMGSAAYKKFVAGDVAASGRAALFGKINAVAGVAIILCAVFAFK